MRQVSLLVLWLLSLLLTPAARCEAQVVVESPIPDHGGLVDAWAIFGDWLTPEESIEAAMEGRGWHDRHILYSRRDLFVLGFAVRTKEAWPVMCSRGWLVDCLRVEVEFNGRRLAESQYGLEFFEDATMGQVFGSDVRFAEPLIGDLPGDLPPDSSVSFRARVVGKEGELPQGLYRIAVSLVTEDPRPGKSGELRVLSDRGDIRLELRDRGNPSDDAREAVMTAALQTSEGDLQVALATVQEGLDANPTSLALLNYLSFLGMELARPDLVDTALEGIRMVLRAQREGLLEPEFARGLVSEDGDGYLTEEAVERLANRARRALGQERDGAGSPK